MTLYNRYDRSIDVEVNMIFSLISSQKNDIGVLIPTTLILLLPMLCFVDDRFE